MAVQKIVLTNITVFKNLDLVLNPGINVFLGENGMGKTHLMKLLYSACKSTKHDVSFPQKVVKVFLPDDSCIRRLISRNRNAKTASVTVISDKAEISMSFNHKTAKWEAEVTGEEQWEKQLADLNCVFIPAKEILSHGWHFEAAVHVGNVEFDETYVDIVSAAKIDITNGQNPKDQKKYLDILQKETNGKVLLEKDRFYLKSGNNTPIEFSLVAEGIRKLSLLWQLIKNGALEKGDILFWDEPEANLNPKFIPVVAEILLQLQRDGVQVFVATHDYFLTKYLEVKRSDHDSIEYHSLFAGDDGILCESRKHLEMLEHNAIHDTFIQLYKDEIRKAMD